MMEKILSLITDHHNLTGGHCGLTAVKISQRTGIDLTSVRKELNKLYQAKEIEVRDGAHGKLVRKL